MKLDSTSLVVAVPARSAEPPAAPTDYRALAPTLSQPDFPVTARSAVSAGRGVPWSSR